LDGYVTSLSAGTSKIYISDGSNYLPDNTVDTEAIVDGTVTSADIADGTIVSGDIADGTIVAGDIATDTITATQLAADSVGSSEIAADAVGAAEIATDAVGAAEIAASAVGTSEIATNAVTADEIAASAVGTSEIADDSVSITADLNLSTDGAGSGLDADLLDGIDSTALMATKVYNMCTTLGCTATCTCPAGYYILYSYAATTPLHYTNLNSYEKCRGNTGEYTSFYDNKAGGCEYSSYTVPTQTVNKSVCCAVVCIKVQ